MYAVFAGITALTDWVSHDEVVEPSVLKADVSAPFASYSLQAVTS
jgi:hypothetical protein